MLRLLPLPFQQPPICKSRLCCTRLLKRKLVEKKTPTCSISCNVWFIPCFVSFRSTLLLQRRDLQHLHSKLLSLSSSPIRDPILDSSLNAITTTFMNIEKKKTKQIVLVSSLQLIPSFRTIQPCFTHKVYKDLPLAARPQ